MLLDTHVHLDFPEFAELDQVLLRAAANGVDEMITIGIDVDSSRQAIALAENHPEIHATVGIHPHGARILSETMLEELRQLGRRPRVVAIGEIGLDYYRDRQPRTIQRQCLRQQLELAVELSLPVVIHVRDAYGDFLEIIRDYAHSLNGLVLHCFSGDWAVARECLNLGGYLSIPGTVTYAKAEIQQDVVRKAPLDCLLLETDAPFLAPVPYRGKTNEPAYLLHTATKVAELRSLTVEDVGRQTTMNARSVFHLSSQPKPS
ncbi:MAG TPA: hydrolase TatD [Syntrophobacteraceae bacterium]|nr:hydrolase TatD [Syntrophobacteraceae bacterium]HBZ56307.1 hydrolase TatD [Syntrophobacteraceae bacterium]